MPNQIVAHGDGSNTRVVLDSAGNVTHHSNPEGIGLQRVNPPRPSPEQLQRARESSAPNNTRQATSITLDGLGAPDEQGVARFENGETVQHAAPFTERILNMSDDDLESHRRLIEERKAGLKRGSSEFASLVDQETVVLREMMRRGLV